MTTLQRKWGVYLCQCSVPEGFRLGAIEQSGAVVVLAGGAADQPAFAERLRGAFTEHVLYGCACTDVDELEAACEAVGIAPEIHPLALAATATAVHAADEAAAKARRLVLAAIAGIDARPPVHENLLTVGDRVVLFTDRPDGLEVAKQVSGQAALVVFLAGKPEDFGGAQRGVNWGRPKHIAGRLGALEVVVDAVEGSDFAGSQRVQADQAIVVGAAAGKLRSRTGVHLLPEPSAEAIAQVAAEAASLIGSFSKPEHVRYDAAICAGGAADLEACGRCIPACPYDAIDRNAGNRLRIHVEHMACEGCGACVSACPTSALKFNDPAPEELFARLGSLLAPRKDEPAAERPAVVFHCEQQGRRLLEWAGAQGEAYPPAVLPVEVPCLRYVSDADMLAAIRMGAAGVGLLGCETCPNGERELLLGKLATANAVLDGFGFGEARVRLLTVRDGGEADALANLRGFGAGVAAPPLPADGKPFRAVGHRDAIAESLGAFIAARGSEPEPVREIAGQPFAFAEVRADGCTLCRACATVCPTHAFAFDTERQELSYKHIACVACGLCERVCPERVITLHSELRPTRQGLDYAIVAQDEMVHCMRCEKPYINRRALETIEAKLRSAESVMDTFTGRRVGLLRMCPDCRAVAAMLEVDEGWTP